MGRPLLLVLLRAGGGGVPGVGWDVRDWMGLDGAVGAGWVDETLARVDAAVGVPRP
ncbi:hypothetical protein [Streptomyces sp. NPDC059256]|uniref:hypothetical protein n=1 Tax=Streptomyces sp. NPDC059256 TaxID=3346794 RepID=UPI00369677B4